LTPNQGLSASSKPYLFDPSYVYSSSPPKGLRKKEKNLYKVM